MLNKILVVDDSPSIRQMLKVILTSHNYPVSAAQDGQEALELCQQQQFDFVLTDQNMPRMDGLTLVASLRALPEYQRTPIIILTTEGSAEMKARGKAAGATGWMVKPFSPEQLLALTAKVLAR